MGGIARIARGDLAGLDALKLDAIALPLYGVREQPMAVAGYADWRLAGRIGRLVKSGKFKGEAGEALLMPTMGRFGVDRIFLLGLGAPSDQSKKQVSERMKQIVAILADARALRVAIGVPEPVRKNARIREASQPGEISMSPVARLFYLWLEAAAELKAEFEEVVLLDPDGSLQSSELHLAEAARKSGLSWQV